MKQYIKTENNMYFCDGLHIPSDPGNRHYKIMMAEVEAGEAEIVESDPEE